MHVPTHRAIGTRLKEKFSGPAGGALESGLRGSGAGEAAAGPVRPSSECATSCSSFEWIRARFAGTTTAFDARFGGADPTPPGRRPAQPWSWLSQGVPSWR